MPAADLGRVITIGAMAERTGVKVETIRYYERIGLLAKPERSEGNQRRYTRRQLDRLAFVKHARDLGFSVSDIAALLMLSDARDEPCASAHTIATSHLASVRDKIARLRLLESELERIAVSCAGGLPAKDCVLIETLADHRRCSHEHERGSEISLKA
jgi:DNA-binding transcriptional MerR regulator